ncbi:hypothetical protein A0128_20220 [Leptospira tipperaryensis]|uniref:DUF5683 domain-containing protein n=1 Tax=Leptospira tipperaryensis TaxID=2564040 RepID=A0A1D7V3C7_9LEPT|nr:hypothetical protein [Leptospira tipperaryensis]AOP36347.1 hypothetical protein A0128_20220 [Leptospira tipperaryensis]
MKRLLVLLLFCSFITAQLNAHRVILKSGEVVTGEWKETEGHNDHIVIITDGIERRIEKKDILELFFEETGNRLCFTPKIELKKKCGLKLLKLNFQTVYYMDENNRYLRISLQDLMDLTIEEPSTKILEQLSQTGFRILISSEQNGNILSKIKKINGESILVQEESSGAPVEILKKEILALTYVLEEESKKEPEKSSNNQSLTLLDYLIPGYYLKNQGHRKSGYTLMGLTALFAMGAFYEFLAARKANSEPPTLIPEGNGSIFWLESGNEEFQKHKRLNQIFILSLAFSYIFNTTLLTFPITYELLFQETERPLEPALGKDQKIEMKININF